MKGLLFTYGLTYGGAVVSLFNPFAGLLIYIAFAILKPEALWHWSVPAGNYSRIIGIALLTGWALNGFGNWNVGRARGIVVALLGFMGWAILSALFAPNQAIAWGFVESTAKIVLPCLVGVTLITSVTQLKQLAWVIVLSQGYIAYIMNESYYSGFNLLQEGGFAGMDNNCHAIAMVTGAGLAFFLGLTEEVKWRKALALIAAMLMAHSVMFAFSRGGLLALIFAASVAFFLVPKRPKHYAIFAAVVLVGIRLAGPEVVQRFSTVFADEENRDASAQSRIDLWRSCCDSMLKHPFVGVGPHHWPLVVADYGWTPGKEAHTTWLQVGAELGIPGVGFLLAFYLLTVVRLWALLRRGRELSIDPWLFDAARMVISSLAGFMLAAQFVTLEGLEIPYYAALLGAGAIRIASRTAFASDIENAADEDNESHESSENSSLISIVT